jgi:small subunit ribosomal protein S1
MCADMLPHNVPFTSEKMYGAIAAAQENGNVVVEIDQLSASERFEDGVANTMPGPVVELDWGPAEQLFEQDDSIEVTITGFNKGGLLTNWGGLPGFLPASQLEQFPECHLVTRRLMALAEWVDRRVTVKIIELEPATNRLILSERAAAVSADDRIQVLNRIQIGDRLEGRVTNLADFGVFVDLGGVEGLLHISELSWGRVLHPGDILRPGQMVEVMVLQVSAELERIALSRKRLLPNPWQAIEERYEPGQLVRGVITNIATFGAFAEVEEGLEGLIHLSELCEEVVSSPHEVLKRGEEVVARVLRVDGGKRRLALSLKSGRE